MSWTLDIAIILIFVLTIVFAAKNGFIKTAISAVSFLVAILVTVSFSAPLAEKLKDTAIAEKIETATEEKLEMIILESKTGVEGLFDGSSEEFNKIVSIAGFNNSDIKEWYDSQKTNGVSPEKAIAQKISPPIIDLIATVLAIIILFFGSMVLLSIAAKVLDKVARLPVLKTFNKIGGVLLGIALAVVRVSLFCFVIGILITNAAFLGNDFIAALDPSKTLLYKFFELIDIFAFIF